METSDDVPAYSNYRHWQSSRQEDKAKKMVQTRSWNGILASKTVAVERDVKKMANCQNTRILNQ